jgi:hypothetical protein
VIYLTDVDPDLSDPRDIALQLFTRRDEAAAEFVVRFDRSAMHPYAATFVRSKAQEWTLRHTIFPLPLDAETRRTAPAGPWAVGQKAALTWA